MDLEIRHIPYVKRAMVQVNNQEAVTVQSSWKRGYTRRLPAKDLRIDMTPMVDLGFLLIAFFVITAELSRPSYLDMAMPKDGPGTPIKESAALTVLLDEKAMYWYEGSWKEADASHSVRALDSPLALRSIIVEKNHRSGKGIPGHSGTEGMMLMIKPAERASYNDLVSLLDEAVIGRVKKYAVLKLTPEETRWLNGQRSIKGN